MGNVRTGTAVLMFVSVVTVLLGTMMLFIPSPIVAFYLLIASIVTVHGCQQTLRYRAHPTVLVGPVLLIVGYNLMLFMLFSFFTLIVAFFLGIATVFGLGSIWGQWDYLKATGEWMGEGHPLYGHR